MKRTPLLIALIFIIPLISFKTFEYEHWRMSALFLSVALLWFTELIPLAVTGLLIPILAILYGITNPEEAFLPFGNQILFLFMGSFFLAKAMQKHGWDRRLSYILLSSKFGANSLQGVLIQVALLCWFLSMWISNTAACAIVVPIVLGLIETINEKVSNKREQRNISLSFLLTCAFASSIGGMATPVGSPPNLMALEFLAAKGIHLTFLQWMGFGLPVSLAMGFLLIVILRWLYPLPDISLNEIKVYFNKELTSLGKTKREEWQVFAVFTLAVILWVFPLTPLPMGGVGILVTALLFILPSSNGESNLTWKEADQIDWGTIWLFGGGLAMGALLDKSGLASSLSIMFFKGTLPLLALGAIVIIAGILLSEFSSNTASTAIIVPLLLGAIPIFGESDIMALTIAAAFGASFGFMLPVSTPPNAIIYGTGKITLKEMMKAGVLFDIMGGVIIFIFMAIGVSL